MIESWTGELNVPEQSRLRLSAEPNFFFSFLTKILIITIKLDHLVLVLVVYFFTLK